MRLTAVEEGCHLLSSHNKLWLFVTRKMCVWSSISCEMITQGESGRGGWAGGENERFGSPRSDLVVRGEGGAGIQPAGEVDGKILGGRSVILVLSRK
jgi:hypothetical protein